jgi:integrase
VVLIKPEGRHWWRARWADPDTGRTIKETLDASLTTAELRADWAVRKSKALARRRHELEGGALPKTGTLLADALDRYFVDHPHLRARTREGYRTAADKLVTFCGPRFGADDLNRPRLAAFCAELAKQPRAAAVRGGKRGQRRADAEPRAPYTINSEILRVGTVLHYARRLGLLPRLNADDLADGLKKLPVSVDAPEFLKPTQLQRLLDTALAHDADTFKATRAEHAGNGTRGSTPRYTSIAPLVALLLLTGMRFGEGLALTWEQIDLDALGDDGHPGGEIILKAVKTKTKRGRVVTFDPRPPCARC